MGFLRFVVFAYSFVNILARKDGDLDHLTIDGDIIIGGLFPIHLIGSNEKKCGLFSEIPGYQYMEAMLHAIDKINNRDDILPGIKLGTIIYDTCRSPTVTADKTLEFIKVTLTNSSEFAGVIGAFKSGNSVIAANLLRVFHIPQISYGSLTVKLSNKDVYNYFFRTVPPDSFFAAALVKFLKRLGWSYVSIIYSTGIWPETGAEEVRNALKLNNICIANDLRLKRFPPEEEFNKVIEKLVINDEQPNVVVLVTIQRDSRNLLIAKKNNKRSNRLTFIGSLEWSNRGDITKDLENIADGTISFGHREAQIPEFENYFQSLRFNNYSRNYNKWIAEYWQETNRCKLQNHQFSFPTSYTTKCTGNERNINYKDVAPVQVVINAVQAMANALDGLQRHLCPGIKIICNKMKPLNRTLLLTFLKNVTFEDAAFHFPVKFNAKQEVDGNYTLYNFRRNNGSFDYFHVGSWVSKLDANGSITGTLLFNQSKVRWGNKTVPLSTCRPYCRRNEIIVQRDYKCCWDCKACGKDDVIVNNTCQTCVEGFLPNENLSGCSKLPLKYVNLDTPLSIFFSLFSCLGIVAGLFVFAVFFKFREHRLIKASGREMCYIMFCGICVIFTVPLFSLARPTRGLCYFRRFIMGISFTICYAPLLMKMWRIHRIFKNSNQLRRINSVGLIGRRSLLFITVALIAIQGIFCAFVFSTDPPKLIEKFYRERNELVLECSFEKSAFVIYFIYNVLLLFCCTFYAFLTRHFPKNFNEALYIGITMYVTCVIWVVFFVTFLNADYSISRVYWLSGSSLVIGWTTLVGLFSPKLYQLYTKKEFSREMLLSWGDSPYMPDESSVDVSGECPRCKIRDSELKEDNNIPMKQTLAFSNPMDINPTN